MRFSPDILRLDGCAALVVVRTPWLRGPRAHAVGVQR